MKSVQYMRILLLAVLLSFSGGAFAETTTDDYFYVSTTDLPPQFLPVPPAAGSKAAQNSIKTVIVAQQHIRPQDLKELRDEQKLRLEIITKVLGAGFTRERLPKTYALLDHILADVENITQLDKAFWHTKRPYLVDPQHVKLLVDPLNGSPAYPSGHTAATYVLAEILGLLYPDRLGDLRARAGAIAYHRIQAGVHSPDDIAAGQLLAMQILGALMENDDFQIDFLAARDEIAGTP